MFFLALTALLDSLRPQPCETGSSLCRTPSKLRFVVLYAGIALAAIGSAGTRFTVATMGANQFDKPEDQGIFFNWYFFTTYVGALISATAIVYIEDSVSWGLGYGLCVVDTLIGLAMFLLGKRFYCHDKPQGSPFMGLARVLVATIRKRKVLLSSKSEDYYHGCDGMPMKAAAMPKKSFGYGISQFTFFQSCENHYGIRCFKEKKKETTNMLHSSFKL